MDEKKLLELKEQIENAKTEVSELKGKKQGLMETLQKDWECSTVKQAEKRLVKMKSEIEELEKQKEKGIKQLENDYEL